MVEKNMISEKDIEREIEKGEEEKRPADFRGKVLPQLMLQDRRIKTGLDFKNAIILGQVSLENLHLDGDLDFKNTIIKGALYLGSAVIKGDLNLEHTSIKGVLNLVGAEIGKSINLDGTIVNGFLSLAKATIKGNLDSINIKINDAYHGGLIVKGDFYLRQINIAGRARIEKGSIEGSLDFSGAYITEDLIIRDTEIQTNLFLKNLTTKGEKKIEGTQYKAVIR